MWMSKIEVEIKVNGVDEKRKIDSRMLLVDFLREELGLTGTHVGCDTTNCGACTVLLDGKAVKSCTVFAARANGKEVLTIEGISKKDEMHPLQKSFLDKNGLQCGYCTSGMIMMAYWYLKKNPNATREEIREALTGNICRCTGYDSIVDAIQWAEKEMEEQPEREMIAHPER